MRIIIVGAGIGGLATALSLHAAGIRDIHIYERTAALRGLGVGINLLPHAMRELSELGLAERVTRLGAAPTSLTYFNRYGQKIWSEPRGIAAGYRWPQLSVHRGQLQLELLDAVRERVGDVVEFGHRLTGITDAEAGVMASFATESGQRDIDGDVVIGADGIHSALRKLRYPDEGGPAWSGLMLWRGTARVEPYLDGTAMVMAGDGEQKFVAYPMQRPGADGRQLVNFIAERRAASAPDANWNRQVDRQPIVELFRDWRFDWLDIPAMIEAADEILEYPMVDREVLPAWTFGRTTLLGDAAHALYPNGSNGASQAILDARSIAFHLSTASSTESALARYEEDRRPATATLLSVTRKTGPESVMQLAFERAPWGFEDVHEVIPEAELEEIAAQYKRAAGFHPDELNSRASLSPRQ